MTVAVVGEESLSVSFIAMEPLYERLLQQKFITSQQAIKFCREACLEYGFNIKQENNNANRSIYIYCSREGLPEQQGAGTSLLRKRPSSLKNYECQWRIVLQQGESQEWTFRKSMNPHASEHNHDILSTSSSEDSWPQEVINKIIQLARSSSQDDEIKDQVKLQFPDIVWNERRFLSYLTEERKRIRQKSITERVQKLIMASTKLCSVVAANEDWASCVEGDLSKMLESYRQMTRVSNQSLDSMVDLQLNMIHSEIDTKQQISGGGLRRHSSAVFKKEQHEDLFGNNTKKRKMTMMASMATQQEGVQIMSIPSCTLFIRSQPLRSLSEPSASSSQTTSTRRANAQAAQQAAAQAQAVQVQAQQHAAQQAMQQQHAYELAQHHHHQPFNVNFTLQTSPISSPSSSSSLQQRMDFSSYNRNDMLQSPPIPDNGGIVSPPNYAGSGGGHGHSPQHYSTSTNVYSFSPYPTSNSQQQGDFAFDQSAGPGGYGGGGGGGGGGASPAPILIHQRNHHHHQMSSGGGYYTASNTSPNSIQQRMMMQQQQQEYEQQQRVLDNHLPIIRSSATTAATANNNLITTATMVQQQQQHHHHSHHHHPAVAHHHQQQQNWS